MKIIALGIAFLSLTAFAAEPMTDGKIVGISMATNQVQLQGSQYAHPKMEYFDVKNFANTMLVDYQNYQNILEDFVYKSGVVPEPSESTREIEARGQQVLEEMAKLAGKPLEKRYIDAQVELHEKTLDMMDRVFLPNVVNPELRNLITSLRGTIQARLEWALKIQALYP